MSGMLIRGGLVVLTDRMVEADVLVEGEQIKAIGVGLPAGGAEVVEAQGLLVLPGVIDAHTHIQLDTGTYRTADDWFVGSRAAAFGGVTTVVDFATQFPGQGFEDALAQRREEAANSVVDYAFHMMVTDLPSGEEDALGQLPDLGIQSIKLYTTYRPLYYADDATLLRLLEAAARYGLTSLVHCENDALVTAQTALLVQEDHAGWCYHAASRPALAEEEATARVLLLADRAGALVVIAHNSLAATVERVHAARLNGQRVFCETAPQYLLLGNDVYQGTEPWRYILQPPLRGSEEQERLWRQVSSGRVDMLITDHCDYSREQKLAFDDFTRTPGGLPGIETLLPLMATYGVAEGRLDWLRLMRMLAVNPAQIYGLWPRKGALAPGADADLVLFDPDWQGYVDETTLHMAAGYSPFDGMQVQGRVVSTVRRGEFLVREGEFVGRKGGGRFLPRGTEDRTGP